MIYSTILLQLPLYHFNLIPIYISRCHMEGSQQKDSPVGRLKKLKSQLNVPFFRSESVMMDNFEIIMKNNKIWSDQKLEIDPEYFERLSHVQEPEYLWIGCSDSRVPANQIVGLQPGELFVHRNIANQAPPSDINVLAVVQYSVQVLKVKDIIIAGHYGCGGIKAAFRKHDHGPLEAWLSHIRDIRYRYRKDLNRQKEEENENLLSELNVKQQVYNVARIPIVQEAWRTGQELRIHGLIYNLMDGRLKDLGITLSRLTHIPEEFWIIE